MRYKTKSNKRMNKKNKLELTDTNSMVVTKGKGDKWVVKGRGSNIW